jgi:hypothetical protein
MDYKNSKIYKLVGGGLTYYGSTCSTLTRRLCGHKSKFATGKLKATSKLLFDTRDEVKIFLVEKFPCADRMELNARERWYIEQNDCVNKNIPTRTDKEYRDANKEQIKEKREMNKEYFKHYRELNKDKIKEQISKRRSEKITCECGALVSKCNILRHRTSKRHILSTTE